MGSTPPKIIVILGPTASGKSDLAVQLAKKFKGEIISADSRQIYKGLNIGSGKITKKEMQDVPHYLLDVASPKSTFTVSQYQKLAGKAIKEILRKGKIPIVCGGTGFYIDALVYNYKLPEIPPNPKLRKELEKKSADALFKQLKKLDPARAKNIDQFNKRRLIRALEIVLTTKKPVPNIIARDNTNYDVLFLGIKKPQEELKKLIAKRLEKRLKQSMITEVKNLHKSGVSWKKLESFGLEYRWLARYLQNKIGYAEMIQLLQKDIEHYAKRQMTWFKRNKKIHWIKNYKQTEKLTDNFL
ncbi:MAG: tRNA (adenosine(37)-N6)-dimethylallyltransferase MiaA [Candidatus Paceibacterota bacterium]